MKQSIMISILSGILGTCTLSAYHLPSVVIQDSAEGKKILLLQTSKRDRLYWGPDVFWSDESPNIKGIPIQGNSIYYGLRGGYDFLKPNSMYAGVDALYAIGRTKLNVDFDKIKQLNDKIFNDKITGTVARIEGRLGYNFAAQKPFYFSPFIGFGGYHSRSVKVVHFVQNWLYFTMGMKAEYEVSPTFSAGVNVKGMKALFLEQSIEKGSLGAAMHDNSNVLGYEISVPLTARFGHSHSWDVRIEPYYIKLNSQSDANVAGTQMTFSKRF